MDSLVASHGSPSTSTAQQDGKRFRNMPYSSTNETIRSYTGFGVKLCETAVDFFQKLSQLEDQHSQQLSSLVKSFKKRTAESLKKDMPISSSTQFTAWEAILDQTDMEAKACSDLSQMLSNSVAQQLTDITNRKKQLLKSWFAFREQYMSRVDKAEDSVEKLFSHYSEEWCRYAQSLEKDTLKSKDTVILHSYNAHNEYIMQLTGFNSLHDVYYGKQIYDMLDELQAIHEDLARGFTTCMQRQAQLYTEKYEQSIRVVQQIQSSAASIHPSTDVSLFVQGQDLSSKSYPPPKLHFQTPEIPPSKSPDAKPINLSPLDDSLQLIDMTQAPLLHANDTLRKKESDLQGDKEKLQNEYQSVKSLLDSYRDNPSLGDPNTLVGELLDMRNRIRVKEAELSMIKAKLSLFSTMVTLNDNGSRPPVTPPTDDRSEQVSTPTGLPRKTADTLVQGLDHQFVERTQKLPVQCAYCDGIIQPPITKGLKCKVCKVSVHHKCQQYIPFCSGVAPTKSTGMFSAVPKRFSKMLLSKRASQVADDADGDDEEAFYEIPTTHDRGEGSSSDAAPKPPPRGPSLEYNRMSKIEQEFMHSSFDNTLEQTDYCVVLYDYSKVNPNDLDLKCGDIVELINTASQDWWKGRIRDRKGYFPASYVMSAASGQTVMKALYGFVPSSTGELALSEGQIVLMERKDNDGWLYGRSGNEEGLFPENYVQALCVV